MFSFTHYLLYYCHKTWSNGLITRQRDFLRNPVSESLYNKLGKVDIKLGSIA